MIVVRGSFEQPPVVRRGKMVFLWDYMKRYGHLAGFSPGSTVVIVKITRVFSLLIVVAYHNDTENASET